MAADSLAGGAGDLAGAVGVDGELPAFLMQQHVVMPPAPVLKICQAGAAAVLPVPHVVGFTSGGRLVAAAEVAATLWSRGPGK